MNRSNSTRPGSRWRLAVALSLTLAALFVAAAMPDGDRSLSGSGVAARPRQFPDVATPAGFRPIASGGLAADFEMIGLDGTRERLDAHRGRVVLLNFWGTSCGPCMAEMPDLEALSDAYRDRGLDVLLVCVEEDDPAVVSRAVGGRLRRLSPRIDAGMGRLRHDVQSTPTTLLIGRDGRPIARAEGTREWTGPAVRALIDCALSGGG